MYQAIRNLLFRLDPETAHDIACRTLQVASALPNCLNPFYNKVKFNPVTVAGLVFHNRVGLAAGMDKNGDYIDAMASLGFGFIELGSVTERPQKGNLRPRIKLVEDGIVNHMGMPNKGASYVQDAISMAEFHNTLLPPIGVSVAANTDAEDTTESIVATFKEMYPFADYVTINISCPNVPGGLSVNDVFNRISSERDVMEFRSGERKPVFVKIPRGYFFYSDIEAMMWRIKIAGFDGAVVSNIGQDHTSGKSLFMDTADMVQYIKRAFPELAVIASGGIMSVAQGKEMIAAGADLIQIYSGLVYNGPRFVKQLVESL